LKGRGKSRHEASLSGKEKRKGRLDLPGSFYLFNRAGGDKGGMPSTRSKLKRKRRRKGGTELEAEKVFLLKEKERGRRFTLCRAYSGKKRKS